MLQTQTPQPAQLSLAALALMLQAAKLDGYSEGYRDAQPTPAYADVKAGR
jgi:hypothetical protein